MGSQVRKCVAITNPRTNKPGAPFILKKVVTKHFENVFMSQPGPYIYFPGKFLFGAYWFSLAPARRSSNVTRLFHYIRRYIISYKDYFHGHLPAITGYGWRFRAGVLVRTTLCSMQNSSSNLPKSTPRTRIIIVNKLYPFLIHITSNLFQGRFQFTGRAGLLGLYRYVKSWSSVRIWE